jgi:aldehyde:ferredoxin oxidoreductase
MGKLLYVDLENHRTEDKPLDDDFLLKWLGGYGIGARLLYDLVPAGADALGPENILGLITGPLTGTPAIVGSRYEAVGKSPLTGGWGDANSGGDFGPFLKMAGYDGVIVTGRSSSPVYLAIDDGQAEVRDAGELWGLDTHDTEGIIRERMGKDTAVACIGPAGEKKSLIACIINDLGRAAGRSGLGAVMGSKNLKAVAARGRHKIPLADPEKAQELRQFYLPRLAGPLYDTLHNFGTSGVLEGLVAGGDTPVRNWSDAGLEAFPGAAKIGGDAMHELEIKGYGCYRCPIGCGGIVSVSSGPYKVDQTHKPEYETIGAFGTMCGNDNLESIIMANHLCNRFGLDTISTGSTIAFAIDLFEHGIIDRHETDGLELRWGNHEAIVELIGKTARREGFGDVLADGTKRAAEKIGRGAEAYAVQIGGQEVPMHDPRFDPAMGTTYLTDPTPARHTQGSEGLVPPGFDLPERDRRNYAGRGQDHRAMSNLLHVVNSIGCCEFSFWSIDYHSIPAFLTAVTGRDWNIGELLTIGERTETIRQAFDLREGVNPRRWKAPDRVFGRPPLARGPLAGLTVDIDRLVEDYYEAMDWDLETGKPSRERLLALGLEDIADDLHGHPAAMERHQELHPVT